MCIAPSVHIELLPCVCLNCKLCLKWKSESCDDMTKPDVFRISGGVNNFIPDCICV